MGQYITLQKQTTFTGDTSTAPGSSVGEMPPFEDLPDVSDWGVAFITVHTLTVSKTGGDTVEIDIGTMDALRTSGLDPVPNGAAGVCVAFTSVTGNQWYKAFIDLADQPQGAGTYPIENLLGWYVQVQKSGGGGPFSVTFEIFVTLKRPC